MMANEDQRTSADILEPLSAYRQHYKSTFQKNCEEYFDGLVKKSGLDVTANRKTVKEYDAQLKKAEETAKRVSKYRGLKGLLIALIVFGALFLLAGVFLLLSHTLIAGIVLTALGPLLVILCPILLAKKVLPLLKASEEKEREHREAAERLRAEGFRQMAALNALFEGNEAKKLIEQTIPLIQLDDNFNMRRYDYLSGKYGYGEEDDPETSTLGILTGEILGNPFVEERTLMHRMGSHIYSGSIVIHWTTTHTDSEGHVVTDHHSQTLTATVTKPKPCYSRRTRLVYGNEAAPDLHFSRVPAHAEDLSEKARERKIKRGIKAIRKKQKDAIEGQGSFTEMGNEEFDVLFGALDRDNEVQFRLLFTPLAQKNLLALIKDEEGFGDDFSMRKAGCLNYLSSEHSAAWDMEEDRNRYCSYGVDLAKRNFLAFQMQYFENLYFDLAPLLSIPLYQQHKPQEYIYRDSYPRNFTRQECECAVNRMDVHRFAPPDAATESILKTQFLSKEGKSDLVRVTAYSYRAVPRTDFVPVWGGDGRMHEVPVPWIEYLPITGERTVRLKEFGLSDREFGAQAAENSFKAALKKHGEVFGYGRGILCCIVKEEDTAFDADLTIHKHTEV